MQEVRWAVLAVVVRFLLAVESGGGGGGGGYKKELLQMVEDMRGVDLSQSSVDKLQVPLLPWCG